MENGAKYWIISWSKDYIFINDKANPYKIENNLMYVNIVYPSDNSTYIVAVYKKENCKNYSIDEIRRKDKFNGYYKKDNKVVGFWKTVDFIKDGQTFNYRFKRSKVPPILEQIIINPLDNSAVIYLKDRKPRLSKYTSGYIQNIDAPDTMCKYTYKKINCHEYMIVEWKNEDYIYGKKVSGYYVLEKIGGKFMEELFEKEERIYNILSREKCGLSLGKNLYLPSDKRGNVNCLVVAGSGAGKSASFTKTNVFNMLGSYIVTDVWGEIFETTHKYLEENGYKIITINNKKTEYNYEYNPVNHINSDRDIDVLTEILIGNDESDEFWNESCICLMKALLYYVIDNEEKKDLLTCFKLMSLSKEKLFEKLELLPEDSKGAKYYAILKTFPEKTYASVVSTVIMKLSFVINQIPENRNYETKIDFYEIAKNKTIVYLIDNEENKDEKKLINIFIAQYLSQVKYDQEKNETVFLFFDEIDKFGKIYQLPRNIETARARKLSISLITNNLNKVKNIYGDEFYAMINTIDTQMLLGTNVKSDIEYFSDLLGLDVEFIKNDLGRDKLLISEKGLKPIMADKDYFYKHDDWIREV